MPFSIIFHNFAHRIKCYIIMPPNYELPHNS